MDLRILATYMCECLHSCAWLHTSVHACMHVYDLYNGSTMSICTWLHMCMYAYTIAMSMIFTHTYIHTYIHTCSNCTFLREISSNYCSNWRSKLWTKWVRKLRTGMYQMCSFCMFVTCVSVCFVTCAKFIVCDCGFCLICMDVCFLGCDLPLTKCVHGMYLVCIFSKCLARIFGKHYIVRMFIWWIGVSCVFVCMHGIVCSS